ncbi:cell shape determining protein MreB [Williamsoniiplasma somnilux]|uniref:Cell shape determining protein MreB n=1 Tax=Williamsoniiplasma somnilux TaxID=215578 RepID=A0A2K8NX33_9MOLU|nr:rod shape-determining protein [Williamsoniiplasma somnilux]ATZ18390.1 cell shape determining protein MreB [Williamsoniiplasma somnilux]
MSKRIGIVFGGELIKITSKENGILYNDFSLVCWDKKTREILAIGADAKKLINKIEAPLIVFNPIMDGEIQDTAIFKLMMNEILKPLEDYLKDAEIFVSYNPDENNYNNEFILNLLDEYKPDKVYFENRLILAAIGAGANIKDEYGYLVLDISYSKAYIGVIVDEKIISWSVSNLAERDINKQIELYFKNKIALIIDNESVQRIKFSIGSLIKLRDDLSISISGRDMTTGEIKKITVSDSDFKKVFTNLFASYKTMITHTLEKCSIQTRTGIVKNGLIVTGDLAKILGVKSFFEDFFNFPARVSKAAGNSIIEGTIKIKK